jgi:Bacterial SH3 domain
MAAVGGAVLTLIIVALVVRHGRPDTERTTAAPVPPADSTPVPKAPVAAVAKGSAAAKASPAAKGPDSATVPPSAAAGSQRYAQTWVNVRGDRTRSAPTVGMLNPGDAVTVDSLVRGWYRVSIDGRTLGYVYRSMLDVSRPE